MKGTYLPALKALREMASATFSLTMKKAEVHDGNHDHLVKHLQFLDILSQRIDHLTTAHENIMALHVDDLFKYSFLHLQYFQFEVVAHDLLNSLHEIETYVRNILCDQELIFFFESSPTIQEQVEVIRRTIREEAGPVNIIGMRPLTTRQSSICLQLYTMASERIVLDWFLANSANQTTESLLAHYREKITRDNNQSELF
jgi:hypothetical protein